MVTQATQYRNTVREGLHCNAAPKKRLLTKLDRLLNSYTEEHDEVSMDSLAVAFGSPAEMADTLMRDITAEEMAQYRKQSTLKKAALCVLLAVVAAFTVWLYFFKEVGLTYTEERGTLSAFSVTEEYAQSHLNGEIVL